MDRLLKIMAQLRDPERGCPWDREQSFETIAPCTVEEAYEVADAIERNDLEGLKEELGDLLFNVVFHAQIAKEKGVFGFEDIVQIVSEKMVHRHPHVFGEARADRAEDVPEIWERQKSREPGKSGSESLLDGIAQGLPPLVRAMKLQKRVERAGFDANKPEELLSQLKHYIKNIEHLFDKKEEISISEVVGEAFFTLLSLARKMECDPEMALRTKNRAFESLFRRMEMDLKSAYQDLANMPRDEKRQAWKERRDSSDREDIRNFA